VPFGDNPSLRAHPALKGVQLPEKLGATGAPGVLATRTGLLFVGGGDMGSCRQPANRRRFVDMAGRPPDHWHTDNLPFRERETVRESLQRVRVMTPS